MNQQNENKPVEKAEKVDSTNVKPVVAQSVEKKEVKAPIVVKKAVEKKSAVTKEVKAQKKVKEPGTETKAEVKPKTVEVVASKPEANKPIAPVKEEVKVNKPVRVQDDLYDFVNGKALAKRKIPSDEVEVGGFMDLYKGVEKRLLADFKKFSKAPKKAPKEMVQAVELYNLFLKDDKLTPAQGIKKLLPVLKVIRNTKNIEEFNENAKFFYKNRVELPVRFGVDVDMYNTKQHVLTLVGPSIILPDTSMYNEKDPSGKQLLGIYGGMVKKLLSYVPGLKEQDRESIVSNTLAFDALIAKYVKSNVEWADMVKAINMISFKDARKQLKGLDFKALIKDIYEKAPKKVNSSDPRFLENFSQLFNEKTFPEYIDWAYVNYLVQNSKYLGKKLRDISGIYSRALSGIPKPSTSVKAAYRMAIQLLSEPVGIYYGRTYFGEEAKKDVINIVKDLIKSYEKRFETNKWLGEKTKEKAKVKLDTMVLKMGYPDEVSKRYRKVKFSTRKGLFEAVKEIDAWFTKYDDSLLFKKVDRSIWPMPGYLVNACYNPSSNDITFPAAILQKPFYSIHQSRAENLGGIGAVIGHEISHAFDNNGANFDEQGNLHNWWTKEDFDQFKLKTQEMIKEMDGLPLPEGKVNGTLVVSESIADLGGMAAALTTLENEPKPDYKSFFTNWAKIWAMKARPDYVKRLLISDVHAPCYWRANKQPQNFEQFYLTFDVKPGDKMYLDPSKRVYIW